MLKNISKMGSVLNKSEQKSISGGKAQESCESFCCAGDSSGGDLYNQCMADCS